MRLSLLRMLLAGLVVVAGLGGVVLAQSAPPQSKQAPEDEFLKGAYTKDTPGITLPKALRTVHPKYTPDTMRMKLQGQVRVQAVVAADGKVDRARVIQSLHPQLDNSALEAVSQWTFEPGKLKDKAVPVLVEMDLDFRLH